MLQAVCTANCKARKAAWVHCAALQASPVSPLAPGPGLAPSAATFAALEPESPPPWLSCQPAVLKRNMP